MLLDTDILVDIWREHPAAVAWFTELPAWPSVSGFAAMELLCGCKDMAAWRSALNLLRPLPVVWPSEQDLSRALWEFTALKLSHNLGLIDSLIGTTALGRGEPLATFNVSHFRAMPGLITVQPYTQ